MSAVAAGLGGDTPAAMCKQAGMTLVSTVGGASGPLYGTFFLRFAGSAGDAAAQSSSVVEISTHGTPSSSARDFMRAPGGEAGRGTAAAARG